MAVKHEIEMKKKEAQLAAANQRRKEIEKRLDEKFKNYDQTLIHAKKVEDQQRVTWNISIQKPPVEIINIA